MTTDDNPLRRVLEDRVALHATLNHHAVLERLVLKVGTFSEGMHLNETYLAHNRITRGKSGFCFMNAFQNVQPGFTYCEGFAMRKDFELPIHHAWLVHDVYGKAVDPTWDRPEECLYAGIKVDAKTLNRIIMRNRYYGLLDSGTGYDFKTIKELYPEVESLHPTLAEVYQHLQVRGRGRRQ